MLLQPVILFYLSPFGNIFPVDWKISGSKLTRLQHYITSYARYPTSMKTVDADYGMSFSESCWPLWWRHLYLSDKLLMLSNSLRININLDLFKEMDTRSFPDRKIGMPYFSSRTAIPVFERTYLRFGTGFLLSPAHSIFTMGWNAELFPQPFSLPGAFCSEIFGSFIGYGLYYIQGNIFLSAGATAFSLKGSAKALLCMKTAPIT